MRVPAEWTKNLKNNIITTEMLDAALYSVNKRAKNCRDKKRECGHKNRKSYGGYYDNVEQYEAKEKDYYQKKEALLKFLSPTCIHVEHLGFEKRDRIYDYEKDFDSKLAKALCKGEICWVNSFVNRDNDYDYYGYYDDSNRTFFFDVMDFEKEKVKYYLFYEIGEHSYHSPIDSEDVAAYKLPIIYIDHLNTHGRDIDQLYSVQFVNKIITRLESGNVVLSLDDPKHIDYGNVYDFDKHVAAIRSQNIHFGLKYLGDYLFNQLNNKIKKRPIDVKWLVETKKEQVEQVQTHYDEQLRERVQLITASNRTKLKEIECKIKSVKGKSPTSPKDRKKREKSVKRERNKLCKIGTVSYKESSHKLDSYDFWKDLFCMADDTTFATHVNNINNFNDLVDEYDQWLNRNDQLNCLQIEAIRMQYFKDHIDEIVAEYMGDINTKKNELITECDAIINN